MKRYLAQNTGLPSTLRLIIYILIICGLCLLSYMVTGADDNPDPSQNYPSGFVQDHMGQNLQDLQ